MKLNKKIISRRKLIKVKKSWLIVPLVSILMNNTALVLARASDNGTQYVEDNESFLKALKNKDVYSIYLEHDIKLNGQSLINDVPRRNLSINLSNHHLNLGNSEWKFINDFLDTPVQIKIQFIDGYLDVDRVDQIKKNYNDKNNQVNFELSQIKPTSLVSNVELNDNGSSNELNSNINGLESSSANQNINHDSEGVSSNYSSAVINASASQVNHSYNSTNNSEWDGSNLNTGNQNNESKSSQVNNESKPSSSVQESESIHFNNESMANDTFSESSSKSHSIGETSNSYVVNGGDVNSDVISNSSSLSSTASSSNSAIFNSKEENYKTSLSNHSLNSVVSDTSSSTANSLSSSEPSKNISMTASNYQPNKRSLSSDAKQFDYLNLIPKLKENLSFNRYSSDDFYLSISKILQSLITSKNDLNNRVKSLEANHNISQSSNALNDVSKSLVAVPHRVKVKQKCYIYSSATFDVNKRIRLATNEELADQLIKKQSYSKYGRLRYKVKDGFITANPKFVQKLN